MRDSTVKYSFGIWPSRTDGKHSRGGWGGLETKNPGGERRWEPPIGGHARWPRRSKIEQGGQKVKPKTQAAWADHGRRHKLRNKSESSHWLAAQTSPFWEAWLTLLFVVIKPNWPRWVFPWGNIWGPIMGHRHHQGFPHACASKRQTHPGAGQAATLPDGSTPIHLNVSWLKDLGVRTPWIKF